MAKELFGQDLQSEIGESERFAFGLKGQVGCKNILKSELFSLIGSWFLRSKNDVAITAGTNTISFSSDFGTTDYTLIIYDVTGIGIQFVSQTTSGFTVKSLESGKINYTATKNI